MSKTYAIGRCKATGKLSYKDERTAATALDRLRSARGRRGHMESRVYECESCPRWHLTSLSSWE